jgi:hypothetical protein
LVALATLGILSARASDDGSAQTDIRSEMLSEYSYSGKPRAAAAPLPAPVPAPAPAAASAPDTVVRLPSYIVFESGRNGQLDTAFKAQAAASKQQAILDKLGIGVRVKSFGKHFGVGVVTVFYIPIAVFGGFSW